MGDPLSRARGAKSVSFWEPVSIKEKGYTPVPISCPIGVNPKPFSEQILKYFVGGRPSPVFSYVPAKAFEAAWAVLLSDTIAVTIPNGLTCLVISGKISENCPRRYRLVVALPNFGDKVKYALN